jgi:ATP-binding cassette subfamily B protein
MAICCARLARPAGWQRTAERSAGRSPRRPIRSPCLPPRGQIAFENVTSVIPTRPEVAALSRFHPEDPGAGRDGGDRRPIGRGQVDPVPARQALLRSASGTVKLDGVPLTSADPGRHFAAAWRWCRRKAVLFAASARDNLRYGNWRPSDDADLGCGPRRQCRGNFLRELPEGLDTFLGEGGARLSGGQRSASPLPARCCATRRSCCSTKRPARWTPKASGWCRTRSTG